MYKSSEILTKDARERGVVETWPPDVLRHSFCSYRLAEVQNIGQVSEEAGNSPDIIRRHYRRPIPKARAKDYFEINPTAGGAVVIPIDGERAIEDKMG